MKHPEWKRLYDQAGGMIAGGKKEFAYAELRGEGYRVIEAREHANSAAVVRDRLRGEGLRYNEVLDLVEEAPAERVVKARAAGYRDGLAASRFHPLPLSVVQRRAA